jgi:Tol biopolymer transport system component
VFVPASPARLVVPYYDPFTPDWGYSDPEWSPDGRWIAMIRSDEYFLARQLFVMDSRCIGRWEECREDLVEVPLAETLGLVPYREFAWSPDSRHLAVLCAWQDDPEEFAGLAVADLEQPESIDVRFIPMDPPDRGRQWADFLSWSPGGDRLLYRYTSIPDIYGGFSAESGGGLYTMSPSGQDIRQIRPLGLDEASLVWSPNGRTILVPEPVPDTAIPYWMVVDESGQQAKWVPDYRTFADLEAGSGAVWSPDGKKIALSYLFVVQGEVFGGEIFVANADGSDFVELTGQFDDLPGVNEGPAWSPDGRYVAFISRQYCMIDLSADCQDGMTDIFIVHPDGSGLRKVLPPSPWQGDLSWSPDSQELMLSSEGGYIAIAIGDLQ